MPQNTRGSAPIGGVPGLRAVQGCLFLILAGSGQVAAAGFSQPDARAQSRAQTHRIEIHTPPGLTAEPRVLKGRLAAGARGKFSFRITAAPGAKPGVQLIAFDITRDRRRQGELFDAILEIQSAEP